MDSELRLKFRVRLHNKKPSVINLRTDTCIYTGNRNESSVKILLCRNLSRQSQWTSSEPTLHYRFISISNSRSPHIQVLNIAWEFASKSRQPLGEIIVKQREGLDRFKIGPEPFLDRRVLLWPEVTCWMEKIVMFWFGKQTRALWEHQNILARPPAVTSRNIMTSETVRVPSDFEWKLLNIAPWCISMINCEAVETNSILPLPS